MTQLAERHETYQAEFDAFRQEAAFGSDRVRTARERAFARFLQQGFPSTRDEEWRFTNVGPIAAEVFVRAPQLALDRASIAPFLFDGVGAQIVLVNGRVSKTLSSFAGLPAGVTIETLADPHRAPIAGHADLVPSGPFVNLNDAFYEDVVEIRVKANAIVTEPIHVLALTVAHDHRALVLPRLSLHVGEAAQVSLVESYAGIGGATTLTSAVTTVHLEPGAVVDHVKVQRETDNAFHMATMTAVLSRASTFTSHALTFGGRIARNDIVALLDGEGAECTLNGLYVATGDSVVDTHTTIDHAKAHCPSHEVYKGILAGRSRAVFNGKILVRQDAQKTNAKQTNRALLLTDDAQVNTKPQLEIFADDVKCTHGAAIGQLDEDAMFYLRARGIDDESAKIMLIHAFAGDVLDNIRTESVRETAMKLVEHRLAIG
jgi:Fe-S cluster assembly protein SufD